jgi:hypothetical protein
LELRLSKAVYFPSGQPAWAGSRCFGHTPVCALAIRPRNCCPKVLKERAQVYRWVMFAMTELEQPLWRITRHTMLYPEDKRLPRDVALASESSTSAIS